MSTHKHFDKICCVVIVFILIFTIFFMNAEACGIQKDANVTRYEDKLFDTSRVHKINIIMEDWEAFTTNCQTEEYYDCTVEIDEETYKNVAIRGKGNTSLTQVASFGNNRYSFKIEFDHYDSSNTYYGLDKLCLNNIIQDNTYMKDYLTYQMMAEMGVASPLCSYAYITVNGEDWGLYLAVESVEESFLERNYGSDYGELYKPDSMNMGGGRGNGENFYMEQLGDNSDVDTTKMPDNMPDRMPESMPDNMPDGMKMSSDDVLLKYIDDEIESYANIFDNGKTSITYGDKVRLIQALKKLSNGEELTDTIDVEKVIRYFVVHNFVLNFDSYTGSMIHNYYLYEKDGQLQMIPWDYNLAFGGFQSMDSATKLVNHPIDSPVLGRNVGGNADSNADDNVEDRPMIAWIFGSEEYTELYHRIFAEFIKEYFESGYFAEQFDSVTEMIAPYVEKDPTKFCTYEEFQKGIATLREFCMLRAESINGQLNGRIGSTYDTQENSTLITADDLQIEDMGSMNHMNGGRYKDDTMGQMSDEMGMPGEHMPDFPEKMPNADRKQNHMGKRPENAP